MNVEVCEDNAKKMAAMEYRRLRKRGVSKSKAKKAAKKEEVEWFGELLGRLHCPMPY